MSQLPKCLEMASAPASMWLRNRGFLKKESRTYPVDVPHIPDGTRGVIRAKLGTNASMSQVACH